MEGESKIQSYFAGKNIFVTGGTGFIGRILIEKLLRSCPNVGIIYMLVRTKKNKNPEERLKEYFDDPLYGPLKKLNEKALYKVKLIIGDCCLPELGLDEGAKNIIITKVSCIFHLAATVRFNAPLKTATNINIKATLDLMDLAHKMTNLTSFVHVSTCYTFSSLQLTIEEKMYDPPMKAEKWIQLVDLLDENKLKDMQDTLLESWPNTYTFTKAICEEAVYRLGKTLPMVIQRPSIVFSTCNEPVEGWINNIYGISGVALAMELGVLRVLENNVKAHAEMVPVDLLVNNIIACSWDIGTKRLETKNEKVENEVPIYNFGTDEDNTITTNESYKLQNKFSNDRPLFKQIWHKIHFHTTNHQTAVILTFLLHTIPAFAVDLLCGLVGKKSEYVETYKMLQAHLNVISYFAVREWFFLNDNVRKLFNKMTEEDKKIFNFNMRTLDWNEFYRRSFNGGRLYLLKDPMETIPAAKRKRTYLKIAHYTLVTTLMCLLLGMFYFMMLLFR